MVKSVVRHLNDCLPVKVCLSGQGYGYSEYRSGKTLFNGHGGVNGVNAFCDLRVRGNTTIWIGTVVQEITVTGLISFAFNYKES